MLAPRRRWTHSSHSLITASSCTGWTSLRHSLSWAFVWDILSHVKIFNNIPLTITRAPCADLCSPLTPLAQVAQTRLITYHHIRMYHPERWRLVWSQRLKKTGLNASERSSNELRRLDFGELHRFTWPRRFVFCYPHKCGTDGYLMTGSFS